MVPKNQSPYSLPLDYLDYETDMVMRLLWHRVINGRSFEDSMNQLNTYPVKQLPATIQDMVEDKTIPIIDKTLTFNPKD